MAPLSITEACAAPMKALTNAFARPTVCAKSSRMKRHTLICALLSLARGTIVLAQKPAPVKERNVPPLANDQRDEKLWQRALKLHRSAIVVDTHNDITTMMEDEDYDIGQSSVGKYHTDLARMKEGGLTAEFFSSSWIKSTQSRAARLGARWIRSIGTTVRSNAIRNT